jgi:hypothetical protein
MPIVIIFTNSARLFMAYFPAVFDFDLHLLPFVVSHWSLLCFEPLALASAAASVAYSAVTWFVRSMAERASRQYQTTGSGLQQIFMANKCRATARLLNKTALAGRSGAFRSGATLVV